jgi:hypothetical protein
MYLYYPGSNRYNDYSVNFSPHSRIYNKDRLPTPPSDHVVMADGCIRRNKTGTRRPFGRNVTGMPACSQTNSYFDQSRTSLNTFVVPSVCASVTI